MIEMLTNAADREKATRLNVAYDAVMSVLDHDCINIPAVELRSACDFLTAEYGKLAMKAGR
jgi:hypothetical protein